MKKVSQLGLPNSSKVSAKTKKALEYFIKNGRKPYLENGGMGGDKIRVHITNIAGYGNYFYCMPESGKWAGCKESGQSKWMPSKSPAEFYSLAKQFIPAWVKPRATKGQIGYIKILCYQLNLEPANDWFLDIGKASDAIEKLISQKDAS